MNSCLRRPAVALISTALAASVLGIAPAAYAADGTLAGTVTGSTGPLESVYVTLYHFEADGDGGGYWTQDNDYYDYTDVDGVYSIVAPPGDYRVSFEDFGGENASEFYDDATEVDDPTAQTVTVPDGGTAPAVDVELAPAAHVSGTVLDPDGLPVFDALVAAYRVVGTGSDSDYRFTSFSTTDEDGLYDIGGLPAGTYVVGFEGTFGPGTAIYADEYFDDLPNEYVADRMTLDTAEVLPGVDAQLELDSTISGQLTDVNGAPVDNGFVSAQVAVGSDWLDVDYAEINSDGTYTIDGLPADTYRVCFSADVVDGYTYECWDDAGDVATATDIDLGLNEPRTGVDAELVYGSHEPPADPQVLNTTAPVINGTPQVGSPLTATSGTWSPTPTTLEYYWFAGDAFVQGGTSATYVPTAADLGKIISVDVYAVADGYDWGYSQAIASGPVAAAPVAPVPAPPTPTPTPAPVVDIPAGLAAIVAGLDVAGKPKVGKTVKVAGLDLVLRTAVTYKFQWFAGTKKIKKATKYKLKVLSSMKGKKLSVKVTAIAASTSKSVKLKVGKVR